MKILCIPFTQNNTEHLIHLNSHQLYTLKNQARLVSASEKKMYIFWQHLFAIVIEFSLQENQEIIIISACLQSSD